MASGIFAVLDDIAALMDDMAVTSKIATRKTAGILGDDLAVNAEKATGFLASREIPVLWAITKGSFVNKLIIVPVVLLLNSLLPIATKIALIIGGFYLAYEGISKIIEYLFQSKKKSRKIYIKEEELSLEAEKIKVRSAIITDFILSVEIVIIALSTVMNETLVVKILTVSIVALLATIGVYGIVTLIVRMDDLGYKLILKSDGKGFLFNLGNLLVISLPVIIKSLSVIGTIALILVSGGIFAHQIDFFKDFLTDFPSIIKEVLLGLSTGILTYFVVKLVGKLFGSSKTVEE